MLNRIGRCSVALAAVAWFASATPAAVAAEVSPRFLVHVDGHGDLDGEGPAESAATVVASIVESLRGLARAEQWLSGHIALADWKLTVSVGQGSGFRTVDLGPDSSEVEVDDLAAWIRASIAARPFSSVSTWTLYKEVFKAVLSQPARGELRHQLVRLARTAEPRLDENARRVLLLKTRADLYAAAIDSPLGVPGLEREGWSVVRRSAIAASMTRPLEAELVRRALEDGGGWSECGKVPSGSSLVDVLFSGTGDVTPAGAVRLIAGAEAPKEWSLQVGRIHLARVEGLDGVARVSATAGIAGVVACRFDSKVKPRWVVMRDGSPFEGRRVFRGESLLVRAETDGPFAAGGLAIDLTHDAAEMGDRLCPLSTALADGCRWQPGEDGAYVLTFVEADGTPWPIVKERRSISVVSPPEVAAMATVTPATCADASGPIAFEDQSFLTALPNALCADYTVTLDSPSFELSDDQQQLAYRGMVLQLLRGEDVLRSQPIDHRSGRGQMSFVLEPGSQGASAIDAGDLHLAIRVDPARPPAFRDVDADRTFVVSVSGGASSGFQLSDQRDWFYGVSLAWLLALAAGATYYARRPHFLRLSFYVDGWPDLVAADLVVRAGPNYSDSPVGLTAALGVKELQACRTRGGYKVSLRSVSSESKLPVEIRRPRPLQAFQWGPFRVDVAKVEARQ